MSPNICSRLTGRIAALAVPAVVSLVLFAYSPGRAADNVRQSTSLKFAPADVAFYGSALSNRAQYDAFVNSKAFAKLKQMPIVQMGLGMLKLQWDNSSNEQLAAFKAALEQPENKQLVALLVDAVSHEVFCFGGEGYGELLEFADDLNRANRSVQLEALRGGGGQELIVQRMLEVANKHLDTLKIPDTVIGFKLSDVQPAQAQLARLETLLGKALAGQPDLKKRLSRKAIAGGDFLTARLDGSLIPWDRVPVDELGEARDDFQKLAEKVKQMTLTISLGVLDNYLVLSIGEGTDRLTAWGQGRLLVDRKELAPLRKYEDRRLTSVGYASQAFMKRVGSVDRAMEDLVALFEQLIPLAELEEPLEKELLEDVKKFSAGLQKFIPQPGATSHFTFLTERGYEGFSYNWGENIMLDGSQKLTILDHVGGDPVVMVAARSRYSPDSYDALAKCLGRAVYYAEKIGLEKLGAEEREFYKKVRGDLEPLVKRLDRVNREMLIPAFKDGQGALVIDAKTSNKQWHEALPPADQPLPMLEVALVYGVSDAELLKKAASEYFAIAQGVLDTLHAAEPNEIPEVKLPKPETKEFPSGTVYYYPLPKNLGLATELAPNAGLSKDTFVLSLVPRHTARLLDTTPFKVEGPLADRDRPLAAAAYCNFAGLLDAVGPWVDYAITIGLGEGSGDQNTRAWVSSMKDQIHTGLDVLKCFRGAASVTYRENDAWVRHFERRFQDLQ